MEDIIIKPTESVGNAIEQIAQTIPKANQERVRRAIEGSQALWKENHRLRSSGGKSKSKHRRHVARVPAELAMVAKKIWGDDVFTDKAKFRKFLNDPAGELTLRVPKHTV